MPQKNTFLKENVDSSSKTAGQIAEIASTKSCLGRQLFLLGGFSSVVLVAECVIIWSFFSIAFLKIAAVCWGICLISSLLSILIPGWMARGTHETGLAGILVGMMLRTGIPLTLSLVFFFTFDKIILNRWLFTLLVTYFLFFPFEVWLSLRPFQKSENVEENVV